MLTNLLGFRLEEDFFSSATAPAFELLFIR